MVPAGQEQDLNHADPSLPCQQAAFRLPVDEHYLNCAYMGPLPRVAEAAGCQGLALKRVPARVLPQHFFDQSWQLREQFARLIDAPDAHRIAIHPAVSYAVATAARNFQLNKTDVIVLLEDQFPGNVYAWRRLAEDSGAQLHTVARPEGPVAGKLWNERILDAINTTTRIVAMPAVHWTDGTCFDLVAIGQRAREVGAALIVDATQSAGAIPISVQAVKPDLLVAASYKWMLGPYSLALTYLGERFDGGRPLEETWIGREGSENFGQLVKYTDNYQPGAVRYDVGERSNLALLPVASAAMDLIAQWQPARIARYICDLSAPVIATAAELGFGLEEAAWRSAHLFGLRMPAGLALAQVQDALAKARVHVSLRGDCLRISPNVYNTPADIAALQAVLQQVVRS